MNKKQREELDEMAMLLVNIGEAEHSMHTLGVHEAHRHLTDPSGTDDEAIQRAWDLMLSCCADFKVHPTLRPAFERGFLRMLEQARKA